MSLEKGFESAANQSASLPENAEVNKEKNKSKEKEEKQGELMASFLERNSIDVKEEEKKVSEAIKPSLVDKKEREESPDAINTIAETKKGNEEKELQVAPREMTPTKKVEKEPFEAGQTRRAKMEMPVKKEEDRKEREEVAKEKGREQVRREMDSVVAKPVELEKKDRILPTTKEESKKANASKANAMAVDAYHRVLFSDYYLPRIADPAERISFEREREELTKRISACSQFLPETGLVSEELASEARNVQDLARIFEEKVRNAYNSSHREIEKQSNVDGGSRGEEINAENRIKSINIEKDISSDLNSPSVSVDPRPTRVMQDDPNRSFQEVGKQNIETVDKKRKKTIFSKRNLRDLWNDFLGFFKKEKRIPVHSQTKGEIARKEHSKEAISEVQERIVEKVESHANSVAHPEHPNEDQYLNASDIKLFGVFDGMGGHAKGERASMIAKDVIEQVIRAGLKDVVKIEDAERLVSKAMREANEAIVLENNKAIRKAEAEGGLSESEKNSLMMGTTATVALIFGGKLIVGHVGDSRLYLGRGGNLNQITKDKGPIPEELRDKFDNVINPEEELAEEEKKYWEERNVVFEPLGRDYTKPEVRVCELRKGDKIYLTSDGVHDNLTKNELKDFLLSNDPISSNVEKAVLEARIRGMNDQHAYLEKGREDYREYSKRNRFKVDDITILGVEF